MGSTTLRDAAGLKPVRPSLRHLAAEVAALVTPASARPLAPATMQSLPRGDGHAVLILPGSLRGDGYTAKLRAVLAELGYAAYGWNLGVNLGPTARLISGAAQRVIDQQCDDDRGAARGETRSQIE